MIDISEATVTVMVDDLDRAQAFYTDVLGFTVLYRAGPHFCMTEGGGMKVGLHPRGTTPAAGAAAGGISIGLRVDDIKAAVATLEQAGVAFPCGIVDDDGALLRAEFTDPDGTPLYLMEMRDAR